MQQCISDVFDIPWILHKQAFLANHFWREDFLNISNHLPGSWPTRSPLIFADNTLDTNRSIFNSFGEPFSQFALRFHTDQTCFGIFDVFNIEITHCNYIYIRSDHAETSPLDDCAWGTPGVQLLNWSDPGQVRTIRFRRVWVSWHPAFNAECSELAHLMARMSELCKHLNLPMPKELHRPPHFKHWSDLNSKLFLSGRFS